MSNGPSQASPPEISGSARRIVRVAVAQLAYHPAIRGYLTDPLGEADPEGKLPRSTLPPGVPAPEALRKLHRALSDRVEAAYLQQLTRKLGSVVQACRSWGVQILVLPEYSVPVTALEAIADAAGEMVVVAGSCFVDPAVRKSPVYDRLSAPARPELRQNVAHILYQSKIHGIVAKLHATPEEEPFEMKPASAWSPVRIPEALGGSLGVLICLDFLDRASAQYGALVLPQLGQCRLLAVPALTTKGSLRLFEGHHIEESGPGRRPVLFANHAPGGGSTIFAGERAREEAAAFPLHAGVLEKGEEGVLVADLDLAVVGPGKGGRYGESLPCKPFAAASLVYTGTTPALAAWLTELHEVLPENLEDEDEADALDRAVVWLTENPPPRALATPMQKRRWDRMLQGLEDETSLEALRRLTRELMLPPEVLPLGEVEAALASGAAKVIHGWTQGAEEGAAPFATVAATLSEKALAGETKRRTWTDTARSAWAGVADAARGLVGQPPPSMLTLLDRATETVENQIVKAALEEGDTLALAGRLEEARAVYERARAVAQRQGEANDVHGDKWRLWAARAAIGAATCAANLGDPEGVRALLESIPLNVLDTGRRLRVANLWAGLGEVERARALLPAAGPLSEKDAHAARDVFLRIELMGGRVPRDEDLAASPDVALLAAAVLLNGDEHDAARAAQLARRVLHSPSESPWIRAAALHALVSAVLATAQELPATVVSIPVQDRPEILRDIETSVPPILALPLPEPSRRPLLEAWRALLELTDDVDALAALPQFHEEDGSEKEEETTRQGAVRKAYRLAREGHVEAALQVLPPDTHPWHGRLARVDVLRAAGKDDQALAEALALAEAFPGRARIEMTAAAALARVGRHADALTHALRAREALPTRALRLCVAQYLLSLHRDKEAWDELLGDEPAAGPYILRALAIAADQVHPERALELWQRYVDRSPSDASAKLHVAQLLFLRHRPGDAAQEAWAVFEAHADVLSLIELHRLGSLQGAPLPAAEQKRRARAIAATLQRRFPADPHAEQARLSLLGGAGVLEGEGAERIDFTVLREAGFVRSLTTAQVVDWMRAQSQWTAMVQQLGKRGSLPFALFCAAVTPPVAVPLVIVRLFHRERVEVSFSPPVGLPDIPSGLRLHGADLLVSEVELYILGTLGLLPILRERLSGGGHVHLFRSAWLRVVEDHGLLRAQAETERRADLDSTVAALARLPRLVPGPSEKGRPDVQLALERGALILYYMPVDQELRAAGAPASTTGIPEERRLSPRTVLHWLVERGELSQDAASKILPYFRLDTETPMPEPIPELLLVDAFFLEKLHEQRALTPFLGLFPGAHIGEDAWKGLLDRQSAEVEDRQAADLAEQVHGWIAAGMSDGQVQILPDPPISGLPALRDPENEHLKQLIVEPLQWAASYADALAAHPSWWRLTADFFGSTALVSREMAPHLEWKDEREPHTLVKRLRAGAEQHLSLPILLRVLLALPAEETRRAQELFRLGELGFPDALGEKEIHALFRKYGGLEGATPARILDRMEWMAKEPGHLGGDMARLRLSGAYAAGIFRAFCGETSKDTLQDRPGHVEHPASAAPDTLETLQLDGATAGPLGPQGDVRLPLAEAEALGRSLLGRAEAITHTTRTDFLDVVFRYLAAETASSPRLAWERDAADGGYSRKLDGPLPVLWDFLQAWAGSGGPRRAAYERGVREVWLLIDGRDDAGIQIMGAALDHAVAGRHVAGDLRFTDLAMEAEAILSALWSWRPTSMRGTSLSHPEIPEKIRLFDEQVLTFGALPQTRLGLDEGGRFVVFLFPVPGTSRNIQVIAPVEAILLRQAPDEQTQQFATELKRTQGIHDGRAYQLLAGLARHPSRKSIRRAVARRAVSALWRAVRDDPTYLVRWPRSRGIGSSGARPSLRELRAILSEPGELGPEEEHPGALLHGRVFDEGGIWRSREDQFELAQMAFDVPGGLMFGMIPSMLGDRYERNVADALEIAEHSEDHPIARVGRSILLLRAGAAQRPLLKLPSGESIDLQEKLPELLRQILDRTVAEPSAGTLAAAEPLLLRVCMQVLFDLAGPEPLSVRDGLWLTYRLFQWLWAQLEAISPDARAAAMRDLTALAPPQGTPMDRLDPRGFGRDGFDHRLATVLFSLAAMQQPALLMGRTPDSPKGIPFRLAWQPAMVDRLVELASRLDESTGLRSALDWGGPDNIGDLALVALLRTEPNAFARVPEPARLARLRRLPEDPERMDEGDQALFLPLVAQAAVFGASLSEEERQILVARLQALPAGEVASRWRMQVFPSFFAHGVAEVTETEATLALQEGLDHALSPMALSYLLIGVAARDLPRVGVVLDAVLAEAERRHIDPVPLAAGVGRVALFVEEPARGTLVERLRDLATRPPFQGDDRMRELMVALESR